MILVPRMEMTQKKKGVTTHHSGIVWEFKRWGDWRRAAKGNMAFAKMGRNRRHLEEAFHLQGTSGH